MAKENVTNEMEELEVKIKKLKDKKKELENNYTFKGLYKQVAGRDNILKNLKDDDKLEDIEKFDQAIVKLKEFIKQFE